MKEFFHSKNVKTTAFIMIIAIALVLVFFGIYGISRIQHEVEGNKKIYSTVETYDWDETQTFDVSVYNSVTLPEDGELNVLMLTDTHLNDDGWFGGNVWVDNIRNQKVYNDITKMVNAEKPDLIYITGDLLTDKMNDVITQKFCDFMDTFQIPWTMTFGNHDSEHRADKATLANIVSKAKYGLFQIGPTNLQGLGNTVLPVKNAEGEIVYAYILMDFGDWQQRKDPDKAYSTVDAGVTENQMKWYNWVVDGLAATRGAAVETALLAHIPMHAYTYAVKLATFFPGENNKFLYHDDPFETESEFGYANQAFTDYRALYYATGYRGEETFTFDMYNEYKENDAFYNMICKKGSTKQMISGHNHCDGYSVTLDGITFTSVVKTGDIYVDSACDNNFRGGTAFRFAFNDGISISSRPINAKKLK